MKSKIRRLPEPQDAVPAAEALPASSLVHYYENDGFRELAEYHSDHTLEHLDDDALIIGSDIQNGEVALYRLQFGDGCDFWVQPSEVTPL